MATEKESTGIRYLHLISIGVGIVSAAIIIKTYFDNRQHYKTQRDISEMQRELIQYQLANERSNQKFQNQVLDDENMKKFRNFLAANKINNIGLRA